MPKRANGSNGKSAAVGKRAKRSVNYDETAEEEEVNKKKLVQSKLSFAKSAAKPQKKEEVVKEEALSDEEEEVKPKAKAAKKGTAVKGDNLLPANWYEDSKSKLFVGAHVSISGGIENSIIEAGTLGAQAIGLFLCSQRTRNVKELDEKSVTNFKKTCEEYGFPGKLFLPHASYLMNLGSNDEALRNKSRTLFLDGMTRCDRLGIELYNFHPGSTCGKISIEKCLKHIADAINWAHGKTKNVIAVIENMCKQGNTVGGDFKEIKQIIDMVDDKSRVGVCFDTCHAYAAGYDIKSEAGYNKTFEEFDSIIGLKYLKAFHLNDSKGACNSHLDRHENIGKGLLGIKTFKRFMNDSRFRNLPMILETPVPDTNPLIYKKEIATLYALLDEQ